jgi:hypothetical protein
MAWGGFSKNNLIKLLNTLKSNADKKDYPFVNKGGYYSQIADATHAYTDPMIAYDYIRKAKSTYLYNISTPDKTNSKFRCGWLTRNTLSFTPYGLYICKFSYKNSGKGLQYSSTLNQWETAAVEMAKENKSGYIKIFDWGASPESIEKIAANNTFDYTSSADAYGTSNNTSSIGGGAYSGVGGVSNLGSYTNSSSYPHNSQPESKESILNTLVSGSPTPNDIKKCSELLTTDKKKGIKLKSEA